MVCKLKNNGSAVVNGFFGRIILFSYLLLLGACSSNSIDVASVANSGQNTPVDAKASRNVNSKKYSSNLVDDLKMYCSLVDRRQNFQTLLQYSQTKCQYARSPAAVEKCSAPHRSLQANLVDIDERIKMNVGKFKFKWSIDDLKPACSSYSFKAANAAIM